MPSFMRFSKAWNDTGSVMSEIPTIKSHLVESAAQDAGGNDLERFFSPRSVAVVGASPKRGNLGGKIVAGLDAQGYPGTLTVVNPAGEQVSVHNAVTDVRQLPAGTDLAILAIPVMEIRALISS